MHQRARLLVRGKLASLPEKAVANTLLVTTKHMHTRCANRHALVSHRHPFSTIASALQTQSPPIPPDPLTKPPHPTELSS